MGEVILRRGVEAFDQPWMGQDFAESDSLGRVCLQHSVDEIAAFYTRLAKDSHWRTDMLTRRKPWWVVDMAFFDLGVQLRHTLVVKGDFTTHQDIEDDAKTPYIHLGPRVLFGLQQLGGGKIQAATERLEQALWREQVAQPKVDDLDISRLADEYVFDLQVSVDDAVAVAIIQCTCDLTGEFAGLLLFEAAMGDDVVEHLTAVDVFEEHVPVVVGPNHVTHAADIRMVQEADDGSLPCCSYLLRMVGPLAVGLAVVLVRGLSRNDLDGDLPKISGHTARDMSPPCLE